jgi:hypothetical protein
MPKRSNRAKFSQKKLNHLGMLRNQKGLNCKPCLLLAMQHKMFQIFKKQHFRQCTVIINIKFMLGVVMHAFL